MNVTKKTIEHVANLARLNLSENETDMLTSQMQNIIHYVDKLSELDTDNVVPTAHVIPLCNVFREDTVQPSYDAEKILANAPSCEGNCFKVPGVVE